MPNKRISELSELTSTSPTDLIAIVNSGETKKITVNNLVGSTPPEYATNTIDHTDSPYTIQSADVVLLVDTSTSDVTVNLFASVDKHTLWIKNIGTGTVTVDGDGSETIDGSLTKELAQNSTMHIVGDGSDWWIL